MTTVAIELTRIQPTFTSERLTPEQYLRRVQAIVAQAQLSHCEKDIAQLIEAGARHIRALKEFVATKAAVEKSIEAGNFGDLGKLRDVYQGAIKKLVTAIRPAPALPEAPQYGPEELTIDADAW